MNHQQTFESRVQALLAQMTLSEKVGQLVQIPTTEEELPRIDPLIQQSKLGSICLALGGLAGNHPSPMPSAEQLNAWQKMAVEETRLGIPLLYGRDVIHGFRTIFPIPLGQAAGWNPQAMQACCRHAATEARSCGVHWTWAPMVDLIRDPRWGRCAESFGEDPYLLACLAAAAVRGFQGNPDGSDLSSKEYIAACAKHFVGYGAATGGRDCNTTEIPRSTLHNTYLPPFIAAIQAGCRTVMSGYQDLDGEPITSSRYMLSTLLRDQLGFEGMVVSDYDCISDLILHRTAECRADAAKQAIHAGLDMDMASRCYLDQLESLVEDGIVPIQELDTAVSRVLTLKFELGLFENPYVDTAAVLGDAVSEEGFKLAHRVATEATVLLENRDGVLPLANQGERIALTGLLAKDSRSLLGTWMLDGRPEHTQTIETSFKARLPDSQRITALSGLPDRDLDDCAAADVIVAILGEDQRRSGEEHSIADIGMPPGQVDYLKQLYRLGKPVIAVVYAGRPLVLSEVREYCTALLWIPHPGTAAAESLMDILFGQAEPLGRLPVTLPRHCGQVPIYYNAHSTPKRFPDQTDETITCKDVRAYRYQDIATGPLYPFGFGLGYTDWKIDQVRVEKAHYLPGESIRVQAEVTNAGPRDGETVVQLYLQDCVASLTRPIRELKAFQRIQMKSGEHRLLTFELDEDELSFQSREGETLLEPGRFKVWVGLDSQGQLEAGFELRV